MTSVDKLMREVAWLITKPEDVPILRRTIQECLRIYPERRRLYMNTYTDDC